MALKLYNSLSRSMEEFKPIHDNQVGLYTCGPTVYNYPHIGNYRAYISSDMLKRYLQYRGYTVRHVMNITDIDDKTIRDSQATGKSLKEFTEFYTSVFFEDRDMLNLVPADIYTKATEYIPEMVAVIETLLEKGYAYKGDDGSIYFDIEKDKEYGKLSHFTLADLKANASGRLKKDEYDKDSAQDFALWKAWDENDGDVFWETHLGKGRPGWHIECSAMSMEELGENFDIHTGGVDNMFPHHENEIAQSECATGKPFAKYFLHNEHLLVEGKKMSKSAHNFYTLRDIIEMGIDPLGYRLWLYMAHYRSLANLNIESLKGAETARKKLHKIFLSLESLNGIISPEYKDQFMTYMDDDLNTPKAIALMWDMIHDQTLSNADKRATLLDFDQVLGLGLALLKEDILPLEIKNLVEEREQARQNKDWAKSDTLRNKLTELHYNVVDTEDGPKVSKR